MINWTSRILATSPARNAPLTPATSKLLQRAERVHVHYVAVTTSRYCAAVGCIRHATYIVSGSLKCELHMSLVIWQAEQPEET